MVEEEWQHIRDGYLDLPAAEIERIRAFFAPPPYKTFAGPPAEYDAQLRRDFLFARWVRSNVAPHKRPGYAIVTLSLKPVGGVPGDATDAQMDAVADLADEYSFGEIRVTHEQNLVLADVEQARLYEIWRKLEALKLAEPNIGLAGDIIACPGLDYCALANARSIPVAQQISKHFADLDAAAGYRRAEDQDLRLHQCLRPPPCGPYRHPRRRQARPGILPDHPRRQRRRERLHRRYRRPGLQHRRVVGAVETIIDTYLKLRGEDERFLDTYRRIGLKPFKEKLYAAH